MAHQLPEFEDAKDKWQAYLVKVEAYFEANDVKDDAKKRALLVAALGTKTIEILNGKVAPKKPNALTYAEVVQTLNSYYDPVPNEISESFKFFHRCQQEGESVHAFIVAIRQMAQNCNFSTMLDRMIRDRIVCGVRSKNLQKQLLAKKDLNLQEAEALALAAESAERDSQGITSDKEQASLLKLSAQYESRAKTAGVQQCNCCGKQGHRTNACRLIQRRCFKCTRRGHLARMCAVNDKTSRMLAVTAQATETEDSDNSASQIWSLTTKRSLIPPIRKEFAWNGIQVTMDIDTGSPVCVIPKSIYETYCHQWPQLQKSELQLSCYLGRLPLLGAITMPVSYEGTTVQCTLTVLDCEGPSLCGRDLLKKLTDECIQVLNVYPQPSRSSQAQEVIPKLLQKNADLFTEGTGLMKGPPARLHIKTGSTPKFFKARKIPFALRDKVSKELDRLVSAGIISPVPHSEWATPIVPVLKKDGTVRICGDFKVTLNPVCEVEQYPLPVIDDIFANLRGGKKFSILDLRDAYNQVELDEDSRKLAVINTPKGLFCYNRLPFGIASAPAIFQRKIESVLQGLPGTQAYLDDVLIAESNNNENANLEAVLQRFREYGIKLRAEKCRFCESSVTYLGHRIDTEGLHPLEKNVDAIRLAPLPRNVAELRSFLGMVTFYNKFLPNLSTVLAPLYKLLEKGAKWVWHTKENSAFQKAKSALCSAPVLTYFDPQLELLLECDASPYGVGATLFHRINGEDRPIGFRSRTLTSAEMKYSQIEREALALVFGVTRFRDYLLGREFTLVTDHRPLLGLLRPDRQTSVMAAARIQRWALLLGAYKYKLICKPGSQMLISDALSRLPQSLQEPEAETENLTEMVLLIDQLDEPAVSHKELQALTEADAVLQEVCRYVTEGWPSVAGDSREMVEYWKRRHELSVEKGMLFWGHRVVIPRTAREKLLKLLHESHQGASTMKTRARVSFWWPGLDQDIQRAASDCKNCVQALPMPPERNRVSWPISRERWSRLHADYAGPISNKMLLVIVDAHSNWIEAIPVSRATANATVDSMRTLFSRFGLPRTIVTDNGTPFTGAEFAQFVQKNGIEHIRTPPYHPQSNGLAERAVRTLKDGLKRMPGVELSTALSRILCNYRNSPQASGVSPSELLLGYRLRTRLDICFSPRNHELPKNPGAESASWYFAPGDAVYVRNYGVGDKWTPGKVKSTSGARLVTVATADGVVRRHVDQVRKRSSDTGASRETATPEEPPPEGQHRTTQDAPKCEADDLSESPVPELRRSTRIRKPVERYGS